MTPGTAYTVKPLSETALIVDFGNLIDENINRLVIGLFHHLQGHPVKGVYDLVPAYSSLAVFYDPLQLTGQSQSAFDTMKDVLSAVINSLEIAARERNSIHEIPVCYDYQCAPDLAALVAEKSISEEAFISIHSGAIYRVYMIGFLPGFAYLGTLDERIAADRKPIPRTHVPAGSVGIAGRQTGIYPMESPGGWQLIGRTPVTMFDAATDPPALMQPGDQVKFYPISLDEYNNYQGGPA